MTSTLVSFFMGIIFLSCNNEAKTTGEKTTEGPQDTVPSASARTVETDENGCRLSEGERWSMINKACIRITVAGIKLDTKDAALDSAKPAFIAFSGDRIRVEIFLPTQKKSVVIRKVSQAGEPERWANGPLTITYKDGLYTLLDEAKVLYEGKLR